MSPVAAQRRGRNGFGGRKKQRQPLPQQQQSQSTSEEESTDGGSVTRCVCGETHNMGLMVQCDQCEVWQHCDCVGLEEKDIPEQYYCEECKPENHSVMRLNHGKMRRSYSSVGRPATPSTSEKKAPKKRMTFNSREASMSLEDVLAARNALEITRSFLDPVPGSPPPPPSFSSPGEITETIEQTEDSKPSKRPREDTEPETEEDQKSTAPAQLNTQEGESADTPMKDTATVTEEDIDSDSAKLGKPKRSYSGRSAKSDEGAKGSDQTVWNGRVTKATEKRGRGASNGRRGNATTTKRAQSSRPRSRTSTPQPAENASVPTPDHQSSIFEKLSPAARESSPPAKVRYPSSRMTISEMNRRTKQILEYISSIQVEMASKDTNGLSGTHVATACTGTTNLVSSPPEHRIASDNHIHPLGAGTGRSNVKPAAIIIPPKKDDDSPSSSMSSASTIPLEESIEERLHNEEKSVAEEALERMSADNITEEEKGEQSSLEIMDMLTRELIKFQRRFGSSSASHFGRGRSRDSHFTEGEREGRRTRSREASANRSTFVSEKRMAQA